MEIQSFILLLIWSILFLYSFYVERGEIIGTAFIIFQFVFVGVGLVFWPFISKSVAESFSTYDIAAISNATFMRANLIHLTGILTAYSSYQVLKRATPFALTKNRFRYYEFPQLKVIFITALLSLFCIYFVMSKLYLLQIVLSTSDVESLISLGEARKKATNSYGINLIVYNLFPAATYACALGYLEFKNRLWRFIAIVSVVLALLSLLLMFQKRPVIIYILGMCFIFKFHQLFSMGKVSALNLYKIIYNLRFVMLFLFVLLVAFYYFYTAHRFENNVLVSIGLNAEAAFTRIFGRLSIPALMYTHYFPAVGEHYSFNNVGLFSTVGQFSLYKDVELVANHFSLVGDQGTLAASTFFDFYGGFGFSGVILGGLFVGVLLFFAYTLMCMRQSKVWLVFLASVLIINIYYLSQASLFRAMAGYGGGLYIASWFLFRFRFPLRPISRK